MATDVTISEGVYADGVGSSKDASAIIQSDSTTQGVAVPRMTTTQRDAITSPMTGLEIYNTTTNEKNIYNGSSWVAIGAGAGDMLIATYDPATIAEQLVGLTAAQTLTNKTIDGDNNPITNIGLAEFDTDVSDTMLFAVGAYLDTPDVTVTSDGTTISINFEKSGTGDVRVVFSTGVSIVDCTPILTATLTAGSDISPQINYVFILVSAPTVLTVSTSDFPATEHARVATVLCQSAASLQTDGAYKVHVWTDHMAGDKFGHLAGINAWIRNRDAKWKPSSGIDTTPNVTVNGGSEDNVDVAISAGIVFQLHEHDYPAFDTATGSDVYVVNHNTAAYTIINDLNAADQDDSGNAIGNNDYTNLVLWGVVNESSGDCKLMLNLPSGFHSTSNGATIDADNLSNRTIPSDYVGVGFLIARLTLKYSTGNNGTWTLIENLDLRSGGLSGGSGTGTTEFADNVFNILNVTDPTKVIDFDASDITPAATRTATMPDRDLNLGTLAFVVTNGSGATATVGDVGYIDEAGDYQTTTTEGFAGNWVVVTVGGADATDIQVVNRGKTTVSYTGTAPNAGEWLITSTTAGSALATATMRPEIFAVVTATGAGGSVDVLLLTQTKFITLVDDELITRVDSHSETEFEATINGAPTTTSVVYNAPSAGSENVIRPASANELGKMTLHNTTRGTSRLISSVDTGTNTITTIASTDSWASTDAITIESRTVTSPAADKYIDIDLSLATVIPTLSRTILISISIFDTTTIGTTLQVHEFEGTISSGRRYSVKTLTLSASVVLQDRTVLNLFERKFAIRMQAGGTGTALHFLKIHGAYLAAP